MEVYSDEKHLLDRLRRSDETALNQLFESYYRYLFKIAHSMLRDTDAAKDCVQEVFLRFWQKREEIEVKTTLKGYLQRSIINESLAFLRKQKTFSQPEAQAALTDPAHSPLEHLESDSLAVLVQAAIERLPEQCRLIFRLSRNQDMTYREIAEHLNLSPKTVENQIGKALRQLRADLAPWLSILLPAFFAHSLFL
jgi:RNA polymerase sigma-70 factor, ECF subfamily